MSLSQHELEIHAQNLQMLNERTPWKWFYEAAEASYRPASDYDIVVSTHPLQVRFESDRIYQSDDPNQTNLTPDLIKAIQKRGIHALECDINHKSKYREKLESHMQEEESGP
jgi:hypothetical protein